MIKRKKDGGFTLIELMIVIAVIGILAVVLVPKVGSIKTQAKNSGLDVNIRTVQAYAESRILKWSKDNSGQAVVADEIDKAMSGKNALVNPIDGDTANAFVESADGSSVPGAVYVKVTEAVSGVGYMVTIEALDANKTEYSSVVVEP